MLGVERIRTVRRHGYAHLFVAVALVFIVIHLPLAQAGSEQVKGVNNFGRVTDLYFRGGEVTSEGVRKLHDMGVRTIIDLTGDREEEAAARRLGMKFYSFPMDGGERPDDAKVDAILKIITEAEEPVYAHCKGGRHRAGTIAALYRIRVQGWTPEKAWKEQQSYGFGSVKDHKQLYAYVYGSGGKRDGADRDSSSAKKKSSGKRDKHDDDDDDDDDD
jgi:protein tyrosine phosphatase (PTP) superfamily phosphohydrolase (DUF442 family)